MPKASPSLRAFNAGEFSALMEGRTDYDRYPASLKFARNMITTTQGPILSRSGTEYVCPVYDETKRSALVPFEYSDIDALDIEMAEGRCRFVLDEGIQTYASVDITADISGATLKFTAAGHGCTVGDQAVLDGFVGVLFNRIGKVTAVAGADVTLDIATPVGFSLPVAPKLARVYHIDNPFGAAQLDALSYVQDDSALYMLTGIKPHKMYRVADFDWRLDPVEFVDGPYFPTNTTGTKLTVAAAPNAIPKMTTNVLPSGVAGGSSAGGANDFFKAFDQDDTTYWTPSTNQTGVLSYEFPAAKAITGYVIYIPASSADASYTHKDYAPSTWTFDGWDGAAWVELHSQTNYVVYDNNRSAFFSFENATAYVKYRLNVKACYRNGPIAPRVMQLYLVEDAGAANTVAASSASGINSGAGFKATDVGRLLRVKGKDGNWRPLKITAYVSATQVQATPQKEPFFENVTTTEWRLGLFSDTSGWPTCAVFFDDRLYLGGASGSPTTLAGSKPGAYETHSPTDPDGTVNDDNGIVLKLKARKLSDVRWLATDEKGLLVGSGSGEWVVTSAAANEALSARSVKARQATARGSARVAPAKVDRVVIFAQRSARNVREFAYSYEVDGYRAPSLTLFASHLGASPVKEMDYAAEPYSIVWVRRGDGTLHGLTYNREENATGWHVHSTKNGAFEAVAIRRSKARDQDLLTFTIARTVGGVPRRYIERMRPLWDFGASRASAFFVDCGFEADVTGQTVTGLHHLAGETIHCLVDGYPVRSVVVSADGTVDLGINGAADEKVIGGLPLARYGLTSRVEAGAADGTAQGKMKRIDRVVIRLWESLGGKVGRLNPETNEVEADPVNTRKLEEALDLPGLWSGDVELSGFPSGYDFDGRVWFGTEDPLPFHVVSIYPRVSSN